MDSSINLMKKKKQQDGKIGYTKQLKLQRQEKEFWQGFNIQDPEEAPHHVNHVDLRCSTITDHQLALLVSRIRSIEMLDLNETEITNEGIKHLTKLEYLAELRLKLCSNIDNDCIHFLSQLTTLKLLHVRSTSITIDGLVHLNGLPNLEKLFFSSHDTEITAEKMNKLFQNLPKAEIIIDGNTFREN